MALTRRQHECLSAIAEFISKKGYSPTYETIASLINVRSLATVHFMVGRILHAGYLVRTGPTTLEVVPAKLHNFPRCSKGHEPVWYFSAECPLCKLLKERQSPSP